MQYLVSVIDDTAGLATPDYDDVRIFGVEGGDPVEAVAAEVQPASAVLLVRLVRSQHLL